MNRTLSYIIDDKNNFLTIGEFLQEQDYSRHVIIHLKQTEQGILLNNKWAYVHTVLNAGDILTVQIIEETSSENIVPTPMQLDIVYEDEDIIVINKAANTPIHPSINNYDNSLANGLAYYYQKQNLPFIFRCVNRLDKDTTGLVLLAKNIYSSSVLSNQVRNRQIHREYLAIVEGKLKQEGTINAPIGRKEGSIIERCIDFEKGQSAITHYKVTAYNNGYSLASIILETGRTHQIRVHMKYINHPLPGDFIYNPNYHHINRQALHSYKLSFLHPITKEAMTFTAPLPDDMRILLQ